MELGQSIILGEISLISYHPSLSKLILRATEFHPEKRINTDIVFYAVRLLCIPVTLIDIKIIQSQAIPDSIKSAIDKDIIESILKGRLKFYLINGNFEPSYYVVAGNVEIVQYEDFGNES